MCMEAGMEAERLESPAAVVETPAAERLETPAVVVEIAAAAAGMETAAAVSQVAVDPVVADDHAVVADDHAVITVDDGVGGGLEQPSMPKPKPSPSLVVSCKEHLWKAVHI